MSDKEKEVIVIEPSNNKIDRRNSQKIERLRVAAYCRVSTGSEEQLESYQSQVRYYKDKITSNSNWELVGIYADEGLSGTQVKWRQNFQRMIDDALAGKIDLIITKSISRFARNTLDTLKYVRLLRERNIAVYFEKENINTLDMAGELLLTILSSLAQAESESISKNVRIGLKMKMRRGEMVGFNGCLGYDYDPTTKTLSINEEEAKTVRYIFKRYTEGAGCFTIAKELTRLKFKTKLGNTVWHESSVRRILKNEKYVGDLILGKTFTQDPISKRRLENFGEEEKYYIRDNHEAIISRELFEKAQEILQKRSGKHSNKGQREKYSRKYAFSSMVQCGFCGSHFTRRTWHAGSEYEKIMWSCVTSIKKGKKNCIHSKSISEEELKSAFIDAFNLLCTKHKEITEEFLKNVEAALNDSNATNDLRKVEKKIGMIENNINKLIDLYLTGVLDQESFENKYSQLLKELEKEKAQAEELQALIKKEDNLKDRINIFRKIFEENEILHEFDREIFESTVERIIVGKIDENGEVNPYVLTFIFRTGMEVEKNRNENLCLHSAYQP
ncbi:MAG: recombinase family protein, partial [Eubacteriales bacterium]